MIDINLLPPEKRRKRKAKLLGGFDIPQEVIIGSAGGLLVLLVLVHVFLTFINLSKHGIHKSLAKQLEEIKPAKEEADAIIMQMRSLQSSLNAIDQVVKEKRIVWAQKLNILSDNLPRGTWVKKVALSEGGLFIEGSAISKEQKEMISVHTFAANLKSDKDFLKDFVDLELGSIQRRKVQTAEVADFLITAKLK